MFMGTIFEENQDLDEFKTIMQEPSKRKRKKQLSDFKNRLWKNPIKDRVFVCLGKLNEDNQQRQHAWVMTINRDFTKVTFWETMKHVKYELSGRIDKDEREWLKNYLSPQLSEKERKKIDAEFKKKMKAELKRKKKEEKKKKEEAEKLAKEKEKQKKLKDLPKNKHKSTKVGKLKTLILTIF